MASADSCTFSVAFLIWPRLPLSRRSVQVSPGTTRFFPSIYLPHLPRMIPCSYRALTCQGALPSYVPFYVVSVRQARGLPVVSLFPHPASFGFHLTVDTLAFGYTLPTTGRVRDFHPLEACAAGRTKPPGWKSYSAGFLLASLCLTNAPVFVSTVQAEFFLPHGIRGVKGQRGGNHSGV